jgi:1-acyl-sn-glycerol-3-phosphate acyltransferase
MRAQNLRIAFMAPFYLLYKLWVGLVFFVMLLPQYPLYWLFTRRYHWVKHAFTMKRWWSAVIQYVILVFTRVRRMAPLPKPPYVVVSNHSSYLDIALMYNVIPDFFVFMGKQEMKRWPLVKVFFENGHCHIAVDRTSKIASVRALIKASHALDNGRCVVIFPEGTIPENDAPGMLPFKNGAFKLAIDKQVPIVPITHLDNWRLLSDPFRPFGRARPGVSKVIVHEAVATKGLTHADVDALRERIYRVINGELNGHQGRQIHN